MIFVVLGTQDKPFFRLLQAVEKQIIDGLITEPVVAQVGNTRFKSNYMQTIDLLSMEDFDNYLQGASLVICHAGYGTLSSALGFKKKVIAAARRFEFGEHVNNHQSQILSDYEKKGYLLALHDFSGLGSLIKRAYSFSPKVYIKENSLLAKTVAEYINNN